MQRRDWTGRVHWLGWQADAAWVRQHYSACRLHRACLWEGDGQVDEELLDDRGLWALQAHQQLGHPG